MAAQKVELKEQKWVVRWAACSADSKVDSKAYLMVEHSVDSKVATLVVQSVASMDDLLAVQWAGLTAATMAAASVAQLAVM